MKNEERISKHSTKECHDIVDRNMKLIHILASLVVLSVIVGCTAIRSSMIGDMEKNRWSEFVGQEVTEVQTVYPEGDAPRNYITTKDGLKKIY